MRRLNDIMRLGIFLIALFGLVACNETQGNIQQKVDRNILKSTVGKDYQRIAALETTSLEALVGDDKAYGELFAQTRLVGGDTLYRHINRYESETRESNIGLLVAKESVRYSYRLFYFRVSPDGIIRDYANGFLGGETSRCVGWIAGIFSKCEDEASFGQTVAQYDALVTTSSGQTLGAWPFEVVAPTADGSVVTPEQTLIVGQ